MRDCKIWLRLPQNHYGDGTFPCTASSQILQDAIKKEMRHAAGREALSAKHDLLAVNLKDMFAIEELSYVVYSRLVELLELEYRRALDEIDRGKKPTGKGGLK